MGYVNGFILDAPEKSKVPWKRLTLRTTFNDTVKYISPVDRLRVEGGGSLFILKRISR